MDMRHKLLISGITFCQQLFKSVTRPSSIRHAKLFTQSECQSVTVLQCSIGKKNLNRNVSTKSLFIDEPVGMVTKSEIKNFLRSSQIPAKEGHTCYIIQPCPLCFHSLRNDNIGILYINMFTGWFSCNSCSHNGDWEDFVEFIDAIELSKSSKIKIPFETANPENIYTSGDLYDQYRNAKKLTELSNKDFKTVLSDFNIKGLTLESLASSDFRYTEENALMIPMYNGKKKIGAIRKLFPDNVNRSSKHVTEPRQIHDSLFGWQSVSETDKEIIITDDPFDMVAIRLKLKKPCVALPFGTSFLSQDLLPLLEQFDQIILWFSKDASSWEATKMFARKLGQERCSFVRITDDQPRPVQALHKGLSLVKILNKIEPVKHPSITSFRYLRNDVYDELKNVESVAGVKWKRFPRLNQLLKGHRTGELTVFTGPTGSGKTTFMSEYSLDLCMQGVNTLWGSFEIRNVRLAKTMLNQFCMKPLYKHLDKFDEWSDRFEELPMYFMKFHGQEDVKNVLKTMSHAVYVYDIQHVIVDNLQFMMGVENHNLERYFQQDVIISAFRKFATVQNCHVTLVIHPRKENDGHLTTASIFGGAKASQEADNILILQHKTFSGEPDGEKYIQVTKNRYDGDLGIMPIEFDKDSLSFALMYMKGKNDSSS